MIVCGKLINFARKMEKMEQIRVLGYKYIIGIVAVVALTVFAACGGKGDRLQGDIPYKMERTRGDSIALAAYTWR